MSNLLNVFGFEETRNRTNAEGEEKPQMRKSCPRKAKEESTNASENRQTRRTIAKTDTPERKLNTAQMKLGSSTTEQVKVTPAGRKYNRRTGTNSNHEVRKSQRKMEKEAKDESFTSQNNRRSTRGHKPKSRFSPSKDVGSKNKKRKNHDIESKFEDQHVKKRKYTKQTSVDDEQRGKKYGRDEDHKKRTIAKEEEEEEDQGEEETSDASEASGSDVENEEEEEENEVEDEESSSSSEDNSEDDYQPCSTTRRKKSAVRKVFSPLESTSDITPKMPARESRGRRYSRVAMNYMNEIPNNDEEVLDQISRGLIPDTVLYRAGQNSMYIPKINPEMITGFGTDASINSIPVEYFKYARSRPKGKSDYADPQKVREIIAAVRKRPIIWDQRIIAHQNNVLVRRAWISLDMELGASDEYTLVRRKQIWKSKKDYYATSYITDSLRKWIFARFTLKSIHEAGMSNPCKIEEHLKVIQNIVHKNFQLICEKYSSPSSVEIKPAST